MLRGVCPFAFVKNDGHRVLMNRSWMQHGVTIIKIAVTAGLIWLLLSQIDVGLVVAIMAGASIPLVITATSLFLVQLACIAWRWRVFIQISQPSLTPPSYRDVLFWTLQGMFFNQALPSSVGGDAVRIYRLAQYRDETVAGYGAVRATGTVFLDRVYGLVGVCLIAAVFLPSLFPFIETPLLVKGIVVLFGAVFLGFGLLLILDLVPKPWRRWRAVAAMAELSRLARSGLTNPRAAAIIWLSTFIGQTAALSVLWVLSKALGVDIPYTITIAVFTVSVLIATAPISVAGWGVREGVMVFLLGFASIASETALALSLLVGLCQIVAGLPGGLIWLMARRKREIAVPS